MIVIVGAGLAGDTAAATLRAEGYDGPVILIGDEPHRPYDRPPLSKEALRDPAHELAVFLRPESWYDEQRITLRLGAPVVAMDPDAHRLSFADGGTLAYEKLLLATGTSARALPFMDRPAIPVFLVRTLDDMRGLRALLMPGARIAIVGAGVIGLEVAATAAQRGCSVDVIEIADRVLGRVAPPLAAAFIADRHRAEGVRLHLSSGQVSLTPNGVGTEAHGEIAADAIVIGIGVAPNSALAEAAGLACRDGIIVDAFGRTSAPDVHAAGDVARYPCGFAGAEVRCENWKHAQAHGAAVARNMLGAAIPYEAASSMWSDQYDLKLQTVGAFADTGEIVRGDPSSGRFVLLYRDREGIVTGAAGINQVKEMRFAQMLIERRVAAEAATLADPATDLRKLAQ